MPKTDNPLIVQSDRTLLLDVHAARAEDCANALIPFAELVRSPEHLHTYQLSALSLWNAASAGFTSEQAVCVLEDFSRYDVPQGVVAWMRETASRFGMLRLVQGPVQEQDGVRDEYVYLLSRSPSIYREIEAHPVARKFLIPCAYEAPLQGACDTTEEERKYCFLLHLTDRGTVKQQLLQLGWPVKDDVPLLNGMPLSLSLRNCTQGGTAFSVRDYQKAAAQALVGDRGPGTGFGTIVLPCGAGKTIVGMEIMNRLQTQTLIVTTNISAVHQWIDELLDKTSLVADQVAEYTGESKQVRPVTVTTYQILTWRPDKVGPYPHFSLFRENSWGLIIYDEVHLLPAPVFRIVADLQAVRRVGLTATLVREDGCEGHVFSLVGPKRYDVPWKELERDKWIASAECVEIRIAQDASQELDYAVASARSKHRLASENPAKLLVVEDLLALYPDDKVLIIGQYIGQLTEIARRLQVPLVTGKTPNGERDSVYDDFRNGKIQVLVVSKVANFAIDLPDASMAIQVSGTFGSRQEEAQRLGRILRPKERTSHFFTLITRNTVEEDFGTNRQKFLAEQGYSYRIIRYENREDLRGQLKPALIDGACK